MKNEELFKLDTYFGTTQFYYYFFDGLFKKEETLKQTILEQLNIPSSTYRTNRKNIISKNNNHIILQTYFKINPIEEKNQQEYDYVLWNLYRCLYFRKLEEIPALSKRLEDFIIENNAFKPLFVLFRILIKILGYKTYKDTLNEINEDVDYIKLFPIEYYHNEFQTLYRLILFYTGEEQLAKKDTYSDMVYPDLAWMYYQFMSIIEYSKMNLESAILYSLEAEKYYLNDFNFTRYFVTRNNIAAFYGYLDNYRASIATLKPILDCMLYQWNDKNMTKLVLTQYIFSLMMSDSLEEVLSVLNHIKVESQVFTPFSLILCVIAYYLKGIKENNIKEDFYRVLVEDRVANDFFVSLYENKKIDSTFIKKYRNLEKIVKKYNLL